MLLYASTSVFMWKSIVFWFCTVWCLHTRCEMRHFYTLRCPASFWLIQCKPYRNRFITAEVIDKSLGARFYGPLCTVAQTWRIVWHFGNKLVLSLNEHKLIANFPASWICRLSYKTFLSLRYHMIYSVVTSTILTDPSVRWTDRRMGDSI